MPSLLRMVLFIASVITALFVFRKIRKSQFFIEDTLFWILFCILLLVLSIFPGISFFFADLLGFQAPVNFIFVIFIFLLVTKVFLLSVKLSKTETKLNELIQKISVQSKEKNDDKNKTGF